MTGQLLKRDATNSLGEVVVFAPPLPAASEARRGPSQQGGSPEVTASVARSDAHASELERMRSELDMLRRNAVDAGHAEGLKLGMKTAEDRSSKAAAQQFLALKELARTLEAAAKDLRDRETEYLTEVVFTAVCRLLGQAWATREGAAAAVRAVLSEANLGGTVTLQVSASDLDRLKAVATAHPELELGHVHFVAHPDVALAGCRVETSEGLLDARLETQLTLLQQALHEARASSQVEARP